MVSQLTNSYFCFYVAIARIKAIVFMVIMVARAGNPT